MFCGMTYYQICWYFLIYSFGGWVLEVIYHAVTMGKVINRGFLNGPVCPVYGCGVISVFAMIHTLESGGHSMNDAMIFLFGVILATAVELLAGWLLDLCFHARWWDYSDKPLNFHGYICAEFSLLWGFAILLVVKVFQAYVERHTPHAASTLGWIVIAILYAIFLADLIVTAMVTRGLNKKLTKLDKLRADMRIVSDRMSDTLATATIDTAKRVEERKVQAALARAELREASELQREKSLEKLRARRVELQAQFDELANSITKHSLYGQGRILRAFPGMKHREHSDLLQELKKAFDRK